MIGADMPMQPIFRVAIMASLLLVAACSSSSSGAPTQNGDVQSVVPMAGRLRPENGASALPGAQLPCGFPLLSGTASCPLAININIPVISNPNAPLSLISGYHPNQIRSAYGFVSSQKALVAIVDAYDDPFAESDLAVYRLTFGLPPCTISNGCFRKVNEGGTSGSYPSANVAWAQEVALDLDMVSAVCPNCPILLVEANSASIADLGTAVDTAAAMGAKAISNSYYAPEWSSELSEDKHYHHPHVAITVASGDQPAAYYPATSRYVTAVGGTSLPEGSGQETAWKYGGSGCSAYEKLPEFQNRIVPCHTRAVVDLSVVADPQTGVSMFSTLAGGWVVAGGTSVGAPVIAAAYALSGRFEGPDYSYDHRSGFHDIPPSGYDLPTGLGTPNGLNGL
jgi:subtilase family serine protease